MDTVSDTVKMDSKTETPWKAELKVICKILRRFDFFFFLYFVSYISTATLENQYIAALTQKEFHKSEPYMDITHNSILQPLRIVPMLKYLCKQESYSEKQNTTVARLLEQVEYNTMISFLATIIPAAFVTLLYGLLSDFIGQRKFIFVMASASTTLKALALICLFYGNRGMGLLIGIDVLCAFIGNFTATIVSLITYVADIIEHRRRFLYMAFSIMLLNIASAIAEGPVLYWIQKNGFQQVLWTVFAGNYFLFKVSMDMMKESQAVAIQYRKMSIVMLPVWLRQMTTPVSSSERSKLAAIFDKPYNLILAGFCTLTFISTAYIWYVTYLTGDYISCSNYKEASLFLDFNFLIDAFGAFGLLVTTIILIGFKREIPFGLVGMISIVAGLIYIPFASSITHVAIAAALMTLHAVPMTLYFSLSSIHTSSETQGMALAVLQCCAALCSAFAHIVIYFVYFRAVRSRQGLWVIAALMLVPASFLIALGTLTKTKKLVRQKTWSKLREKGTDLTIDDDKP